MGVIITFFRYAIYLALLSALIFLIAGLQQKFTGWRFPFIPMHLGLVLASVYLSCSTFAKQYKRYFSALEKIFVIPGIWLITLVYLVVLSYYANPNAAASEEQMQGVVLVFLVFGIVDLILILVTVIFAKRVLVKMGKIDC